MTTPEDPTPPVAAPAPNAFPPSVGGSGLALISGMLFARNVLEVTVHDGSLSLAAWVVPATMLLFVFVLLRASLAVRRRLGAQPDPRSVRRQWLVIALAFALGVGGGVAYSMLEPRGV